MTVRVGDITTDNQTIGVREDIDEAVDILDPVDVPLQQWLPTDTTNVTRVEWLSDSLTPQSFTVISTASLGSPWDVVVSTDAADLIRVGDLMQLEGDTTGIQYLVTAVNTATDTVTVISFGATTDANDPAANNVWLLIGNVRDEGADPLDARGVERGEDYNLTQIGQEKVEATRTARHRGARGGLYGMQDPYDYELGKKFKELAIRFERSLVHGRRYQSGKKRFMGGLFQFITGNSVSNTKANAKTALNALVRAAYEDGSTARTLMVSPAVKAAISENVDPTLRRTTRDERTGGSVIDHFISDFGTLDIMVNRHFPATKGLLLQGDQLARVNFDPYFHEPLAKTGDAEQGHIVGEFTLRVKNGDKAHGVLTLTDAA